jgi:hypothetical protein
MNDLEKCREIFEALMASKGRINLKRKGQGYENANIQTKFRYFMLGWKLAK